MGSPETRKGASRLGSYEILRGLARGGMAELYLARAVGPAGFEKLVVLKQILPHLAANPKFVGLFLDEARLAAALDHPHIAHVYDMGMVDGNYFFTMEYVHGQDLRTILRRAAQLGTPVPIEQAVLIARNVAAGLHYAHERRGPDDALLGIIHRDVSPSNILVSYAGTVKLVDFGVAKATTSSTKTRTGSLKGKIGYMSPEHARGASVDRRTDIYSLGIVLWELVTGRRLYRAENDLATLQMIVNEPAPPPSRHRPDCPPELEAIVQRALDHRVDARYQTALELELALEELAREHRLAQSPTALSAQMRALFTAEIGAWRDAEATGITLTDHLAALGDDATTSDDRLATAGAEFAGDSPAEASVQDPFDDDESVEESAPAVPALAKVVPFAEPAPPVGEVWPEERGALSAAAYESQVSERSGGSITRPRTRARRAMWIGAGVLALGVVVTVVTVAAGAGRDDPARTPVSAPAAAPAPAPAPAVAPAETPSIATHPVDPLPAPAKVDAREPATSTAAVRDRGGSRSRSRSTHRSGGKGGRAGKSAATTPPATATGDATPAANPASAANPAPAGARKPAFDPRAALPPP